MLPAVHRNIKRVIFALFLVPGFFSSTCLAGDGRFPVKVMDGLGREVVVSSLPRRIVSAVPSNTEILYDLGLSERVIAVTSHCGLTCDVTGKRVLAGWSTLDVEKVRSLKPDLVLAFGGLQVPLVDRLDRAGIPTFCFSPRTVAETLDQLRRVGRITGTEERADDLVRSAGERLRGVRERILRVAPEEQVTFLRLISPREGIVAGRYSFQHDVLVQAGGRGVMEDFLVHYGRVDLSRIRTLDPQVIVLNGDDEVAVKRNFAAMDGWKDLRAVREGRIRVMPCRQICHPNFRIVEVVEVLSRFLYPD
ncbi:MAG: ABC transporter substrate-binding protein [Deltaproteobacteria bacterium]|nr:ABC transporter substrate-binding protein [Deltaproteobacteria bacterium]